MIGPAAENYFLCQQRQLYFFIIGALIFPQESVKVENNDICIILRNLFPDFLVMSDQGKMWLLSVAIVLGQTESMGLEFTNGSRHTELFGVKFDVVIN